ncbi:unnamed protein product [Pleuronectes platessa]|uniref:MADF domain-containing protein n=1 Tax=Pleuronectes platessa TaxID=8262 RepID=A0A9N7UMX1_PLEPL|nr:unnamed protein product [Pleuronectes platessa]
MDNREELLAEEVRKYEHIYNPSLSEYKDAEIASNSWKEISANVDLPVEESTKLWRRIRDKYVRQRKAMRSSSGDAPYYQQRTIAIHLLIICGFRRAIRLLIT